MDMCPHCGKEINAAAILGHRNKGGKKTLSDEQRAKRREQMAHARKSRRP